MKRFITPLARTLGLAVVFIALLLMGPVLVLGSGSTDLSTSWRDASRERTGLAPAPAAHPEALVQVYGARAYNWRGAFAVHTWIATKEAGAKDYTRYEVIGWRLRSGRSVVAIEQGWPDRQWYGSPPELYLEIKGKKAAALIPQIDRAARSYPYAHEYKVWPGPNSNTFTAYVARQVPGLEADLPPHAIGKDYLGPNKAFAVSPSNTGYQFSAFGLLGVILSRSEGLEVNLLGLNFGLDPDNLALRLPGIGKLGFIPDEPEANARSITSQSR